MGAELDPNERSRTIAEQGNKRYASPDQTWSYAPIRLRAYDGQVLTQYGTKLPSPAIDCTHLIYQSTLAAGYNVTYKSSGELQAIVNNGGSQDWERVLVPREGDIVVFTFQHAGVIQGYNPDTKSGTYLGAQGENSGVLANQKFTSPPNNTYGAVLGYLRVKPGAYNPTIATVNLDKINDKINKALIEGKRNPYYSPAETIPGVVPITPHGGGLDPEGPDATHSCPIGQQEAQEDPLVIDLSGQGLNIQSRSDQTPYFDYRGNGFAQNTSWIGNGTGLLAFAQPDGLVHSGNDLINTFSQLRTLDTNGDGKIDNQDAGFAQIVVWQDLNQDGVCQLGEVMTLQQLGILSISLQTLKTITVLGDTTINETAVAVMADGSTREVASVNFNISNIYTQDVRGISVDSSVLTLPELQGFGTLANLSIFVVKPRSLERG